MGSLVIWLKHGLQIKDQINFTLKMSKIFDRICYQIKHGEENKKLSIALIVKLIIIR